MPGRRRFQIRAVASSAGADAIRALMAAALAGEQVHAVDRAAAVEPVEEGAETGRTHQATMDVRLRRGESAERLRGALRAVGANRSASVEIIEHECFDGGLQDEPDAKACNATLERWLEIDGVEQLRGNGRGE